MRIVLVHGCFDLLTLGHLEHLEQAKSMGDFLVVSVSNDENVARKGPGRPIRKLSDRIRMLYALSIVDRVWACEGVDATEAIMHFKPEWFIHGIDYRDIGPTPSEKHAMERAGTRYGHSTAEKIESTSDLIRRIKEKCEFL